MFGRAQLEIAVSPDGSVLWANCAVYLLAQLCRRVHLCTTADTARLLVWIEETFKFIERKPTGWNKCTRIRFVFPCFHITHDGIPATYSYCEAIFSHSTGNWLLLLLQWLLLCWRLRVVFRFIATLPNLFCCLRSCVTIVEAVGCCWMYYSMFKVTFSALHFRLYSDLKIVNFGNLTSR